MVYCFISLSDHLLLLQPVTITHHAARAFNILPVLLADTTAFHDCRGHHFKPSFQYDLAEHIAFLANTWLLLIMPVPPRGSSSRYETLLVQLNKISARSK